MPRKSQNLRSVITAAEKHVKKLLAREGTGHDWFHTDRVRNMAMRIAKTEKADVPLVELMALLHELADFKLVGVAQEQQALQNIDHWLTAQNVDQAARQKILEVIANQSFSASGVKRKTLASLAGRIVQDADRLEALGAIGIARCFAYGGKKNRPLHDPKIKPRQGLTTTTYKQGSQTSIQHFYEKILKLKDLMNTDTGKKIAVQRHRFIEKYLHQFYAEWEGKK